MLYIVRERSQRRAYHLSRGDLPSVCVSACDQVQQLPSTPTISRQTEVGLRKKERKKEEKIVVSIVTVLCSLENSDLKGI